MSFELIRIAADGVLYEGWESIQISWDAFSPYIQFVLTTTEIGPPGKTPVFDKWNFPPGTQIDILAGDDIIVTGWVEVYIPQADADQHSITVVGSTRGRIFVESSIDPEKFKGGRFTNLTDNQIMSMFAGASCVSFKDYTIPDLLPIYQIKQGATYYQEMMRIFQQRGKTIMGTPDGGMAVVDNSAWNIFGVSSAIPVLVQGLNIIKMSARLDGKASAEILVVGQNPIGTDLAQHIQPYARLQTSNPEDCRTKVIVDQAITTKTLANRRALWEYSREQLSRTQAIITTPGWRHTGADVVSGHAPFWSVYEGVYVNAPWLQIDCHMGIIKCVYTQNSGVGTITELTLVPPNQFFTTNAYGSEINTSGWQCNSGDIWHTWNIIHGPPSSGAGGPGQGG